MQSRPLSVSLCVAALFSLCLTLAAADFGSYVAVCDTDQVTFVNYPVSNCQGTPSNYSKPLNDCQTELLVMSWNAGCNATNIWYNNFLGTSCSGSSQLTRTYETNVCRNCNNAECKDGPFSKLLSWMHLFSAARVAHRLAASPSASASAPATTNNIPVVAAAAPTATAEPLLTSRTSSRGDYMGSCQNCKLAISLNPNVNQNTRLVCDCHKSDGSLYYNTMIDVLCCVYDHDGHFSPPMRSTRLPDVLSSSPDMQFTLQSNGDVVLHGSLRFNNGTYNPNQQITASTYITNTNGQLYPLYNW